METLKSAVAWLASHPELAAAFALGSVLLAIISIAVLVLAITRMSPDYFIAAAPPRDSWRGRHPLLRFFFRTLKTLAGLVLLLAGIAMLILPGQGLVTMLIGISLIEFPGKRRVELAMVRERHVLNTINWIRARAGRVPIIVEPQAGGSQEH